MVTNTFQKGKFYTLPIVEIREEGFNSFFIVYANGKEYAIRMFDFQKNDPSLQNMKELPCMVKDIHGDNIIFVQNFAQMFGDRYIAGNVYTFIVNKEAYCPLTDYRYYDIRDENKVPFKLKCKRETILVHDQKIRCAISRPNQNKMVLILQDEETTTQARCISPEELLLNAGVEKGLAAFILSSFKHNKGFEEAREYYLQNKAKWVIKAITAITGVESWPDYKSENKVRLLESYNRVCLYILEDSDYLLQFNESERENYQEWIADRVSMTETYLESMNLMKADKCSEEIDNTLNKIKMSGYIYHPHRKMRLLIALFSLQPQLLEEKFDSILNLVAKCAKDWKQPSFNNAFSSFLHYYIMSNQEKVNRQAVVYNSQSKMLLERMIRSICYYLLMTRNEEASTQLYHSILLQYLSYVKSKSISGKDFNKTISANLVEQAFTTLLMSEERHFDLSWSRDYSNIEILAYQLSNIKTKNTTFLTRSYEAHNVRFTVSTDGITFSRSSSGNKEKNILPQGCPDWHNLEIFLDAPIKDTISPHEKNIRKWKTFWNDVELGLFEERKIAPKKKVRKLAPEVGTETFVRVLWKDEENPNRYYCKIEDPRYEGEGWIDTYQRGGSLGMFHYDPKLDIDSFFVDGKPMIFRVRVNSLGSPFEEKRTYTFDCMSFIDDLIREQVSYGEESDCTLFFEDMRNHVLCGITSFGYGIFIPENEKTQQYKIGDSVKVKVIDAKRPNSIQGEIIGEADEEVDVKKAASSLLLDYYNDLYEETQEELDEEAMAVSEDLFEPEYMREIINIVDHKAVLETDNIKAYAFLSIAHILAKMIDDTDTMEYLEHRQHFLCIIEDYGVNGKVNDEELDFLGSKNSDMINKSPYLKQRLEEIRIVNCFGQPEKNDFLWDISHQYDNENIITKLSHLMLSYNMAEGFGLQEHQQAIIAKIKGLLNVNIELPKIYSFGEEDQLTEFKTSIVFPPNNNMREDLSQQTFNIMKVICGMVNAYGGTLYLGVYDTGTAKGLEDDLAYFDGSKDKFDLYVRNAIRNALGDSVNASVKTEYPEAGKHFVYAIKITPSKSPVILKLDNKFYLREGTSTYPMELQELIAIMNERNFAAYEAEEAKDMNTVETTGQAPVIVEEKKPEAPKFKLNNLPEDSIATSTLRKNVTENWMDDYGVDTQFYIRIQSPGSWCVLDDIDWQDGLLTLAIHDEEEDGYIIIVYEDGKVNKVPVSWFIDKKRNKNYTMYSRKKAIFISPAKKDSAILMAYEDDDHKQFLRLDDLSEMEEGTMASAGKTLTDVEFERVFFCEIIDHKDIDSLKRMHNQKRTSLGFQAFTGYGAPEQETMKKIGLQFS